MKTYLHRIKRLHPVLGILILLMTLNSLAPLSALPNPLCALKHVRNMFDRGVNNWQKKLDDAMETRIRAALGVNAPTNTRRASWAEISDPDERAIQAAMDIEASMGRAEEVASSIPPRTTTPGPGIGTDTADAYVDVMTSERVLMSAANLDDVGAGVGYIVRDSGLSDDEIAKMLRDIDDKVLPSKQLFRDMDITAAEVCDSVRVLREAGINIPQGAGGTWSTGGIRQSNHEAATGHAAEILIAGKDVRSGGAVSDFDIDRQKPEYAGAKIDYLLGDSNGKMVQVGVTLATIESKLDDSMATAIAKAKFLEPNRRYVFKYLDKNGAKPAEATIQAMNARILNPKYWLTADDFIPVTSIP